MTGQVPSRRVTERFLRAAWSPNKCVTLGPWGVLPRNGYVCVVLLPTMDGAPAWCESFSERILWVSLVSGHWAKVLRAVVEELRNQAENARRRYVFRRSRAASVVA